MSFDREKFIALRQHNRLSQADVGRELGIDQRQISRYELGVNIPTKRNMAKLEQFFLRYKITTQ
jgi:transcriptional regulator with XRE-family HTH domain